ncbi:Guanine nucleotide-binding protein G(I)/G(S)/G(O) subunit gamma-T2 [Liparis tanakae]|uniref:Guanine nucleotide-binding protein subunit gamma n=1 Tax=Liparis tanakae TaxID=230148 RepID=A0A4Z2J3F1_9TELE|nr:Guanine nucleotide-binding protein G(I)/G(S)/G(O) subunit gamma-T2 [Liparis tanakae]
MKLAHSTAAPMSTYRYGTWMSGFLEKTMHENKSNSINMLKQFQNPNRVKINAPSWLRNLKVCFLLGAAIAAAASLSGADLRMARDMSDKEILKMELDQLKKEVSTTRTPLAANCAETVSLVEELFANDPLIKGVSDDKNPYKGDKGGCTVT